MQNLIFIVLSIIAFSIPFIRNKTDYISITFKSWDKTFEGQVLSELPLTDKEKLFFKDFPGKISKFRTNKNNIIMRYIEKPTRKLHSSSDCFRGLGYDIEFKPIETDKKGIRWGTFIAKKDHNILKVRERIFNQDKNWTDVSSWYWENILKSNNNPSTAITVVEGLNQ